MTIVASFSSKCFPNGELTLGKIPPKKLTERDAEYEEMLNEVYDEYSRVTYSYRGRKVETTRFLDKKAVVSLIGLSPLPNSHKPEKSTVALRERRGLKGITSYQKRLIRNGGWLLEKKFGRSRLSFLTVTVPSLPEGVGEFVGEFWSEIARKFLQELGRELARNGGIDVWVGCTELQEKRFRETGVVAPHLHIIFPGHAGDRRYFLTANRAREIWKRVLENWIKSTFAIETDVNVGASVDLVPVKKSAEGYLSKYLSKGGKIIEEVKESGQEGCIPNAWAHASLQLRRTVKFLTVKIQDDIKEAIIDGIDLVGRKVCTYLYVVKVKIKGEERQVGWVGRLSPPFREVSEDRCAQILEKLCVNKKNQGSSMWKCEGLAEKNG